MQKRREQITGEKRKKTCFCEVEVRLLKLNVLLNLRRRDDDTNIFISLLFLRLDREGLHFTLKLVHLHV